MIKISYTLSSDPFVLREQNGIDLASADLVDLCYSCFGGDLTFEVNDVDFSIITGGGVQILDFAVEFYEASRKVSSGEVGRVAFAGMADEILLRGASPGLVEVSANYVDHSSKVPLKELENSASAFLVELIADLGSKYPKLRRNGNVARLSSLS
ncbi:hypothetical protein OG373_09030 [Streptomyces avidinii]|uniref:hypothetical protein n=1 Tax=Streptomyces avidinii TaxID=1895 RepID=UPI00386995CF|nr:hypothetical protein OG373_09030 [Streptomyces avidinii]